LPIIATPAPQVGELIAAGWPIGVDPENRNVETDLLHLLEIQRRKKVDTGQSYVGGQAVLITITRDGVEQRIVHTWPDDKAGQPIVPLPIDWTAWRLARQTAGLSRLKMEWMVKGGGG
jgi:hypothetical protein